MSSIQHAALAASVLVGILTVPAASQSVEDLSSVSGDLPNVSTSESSPRKVVTEADEDSFTRRVETPFNQFNLEVKSDSMRTQLENPRTRLEVEKSPSKTRWRLETSGASLYITETAAKTVETVETPKGTLEVEISDGERTTSFKGSDRESVERTRTELLNLLEQKKHEIEKRRERMERNSLPDIEVVANKSTASGFGDNDREFVVLVNRDRNQVDLEGWEISDSASSHKLGSVVVEPGERLRIYSGEVDSEVSGTGISWNDGGDTAVLNDPEGRKIDETSY